MKKSSFFLALLSVMTLPNLALAQTAEASPVGVIGFYNVENLFDTVDDSNINDEEYLPDGDNGWDTKRYQEKLKNISSVLANMAGGADIIGLVEIENRQVIEDLVQSPDLRDHQYQIVHFDSPDRRGIDVALIYKTGRFLPFAFKAINLHDPEDPDFKTRDMLWVKGLYLDDTLNIVVNHWPSRRGGKEDKRVLAAQLLRNAVDSVQQLNPEAKIVIMGDFNDDPINKSIRKELRSHNKMSKLEPGDLYNTSLGLFKQGYGTLMYRGAWNLFDQIIISQSLLKSNSNSYYYSDDSFNVFGPDWMRNKEEGLYKGAPMRTFVSGIYYGGYSDHFPSYIVIAQ